MKLFIQIILFLILPAWTFGQGNMLLLKKRGKVMTTYYEGSEIILNSGLGMQQAKIDKLRDDSLSLLQFDIKTNMTPLGVYVLDTAAIYHSIISYKDIIALGKERHGGFDWETSGAGLLGGGTLLTAAGLATWIFSSKNSQYYASPSLVIGSATAAGIGYLLMKSTGHKYKIGKKYSLQFISTR